MVVDGGITDAMQPIPMADTTGVVFTAGTCPSTAQMMVWCGWTGRDHGTQWGRCLWRSGPSSHSNRPPNVDFYSSMCDFFFLHHVIGIFFDILYPLKLKTMVVSFWERYRIKTLKTAHGFLCSFYFKVLYLLFLIMWMHVDICAP